SVTSVDVAKTLRLLVTASNSGGAGAATSQATAPVSPSVAPPQNTSPPAVWGPSVVGKTLSASTGTWSGSPSTYAFQWTRCDAAGANCSGISGATSQSYGLGQQDSGHTVRVLVMATNAGGTAAASSNPSKVIH